MFAYISSEDLSLHFLKPKNNSQNFGHKFWSKSSVLIAKIETKFKNLANII